MLDENDIARLTKIIISNVKPKKIILFGSYAKNDMRSDSDIDILILVDDAVPRLREIMQLLYREISQVVNIPCDILVEHESAFNDRSQLPTIERSIAREGKVLYAA